MNEQLTVKEVSSLLKVPISSVYALASSERTEPIPSFRIGRLIRFDPERVWQWLDRQSLRPLGNLNKGQT